MQQITQKCVSADEMEGHSVKSVGVSLSPVGKCPQDHSPNGLTND